jgi:hypothetical protein
MWVGKDYKPYTGIGIGTHIRICLEVNDKYIKDRVVNVPKMCISEFDILFVIYFY